MAFGIDTCVRVDNRLNIPWDDTESYNIANDNKDDRSIRSSVHDNKGSVHVGECDSWPVSKVENYLARNY